MSARDALFHYDGGHVIHLLRTWRTRPGDPRGPRAIPQCAARSDRPAIPLTDDRADRTLAPCTACERLIIDAAGILHLRRLRHESTP